MWRLFLLQNLLKKRQLAWQHDDNKNLDSPYFADNLNTPDNVYKNTHTKLFKLQFSGASLSSSYKSGSALKQGNPGLFLLGHGPVWQKRKLGYIEWVYSQTNKPPALRVVENALAYSKKPPVI